MRHKNTGTLRQNARVLDSRTEDKQHCLRRQTWGTPKYVLGLDRGISMSSPGRSSDNVDILSARLAQKVSCPLAIEPVEDNQHCTVSRWTVADLDQLARIVAIIAMGQASHAAEIINELKPFHPAVVGADYKSAARRKLTVSAGTKDQEEKRRDQRDGLIFEAISWVATQLMANGEVLSKAPHLSPTTQGLDGLSIEFDAKACQVRQLTILEDKCTKHPRDTFARKVIPEFEKYHAGIRATELLDAAAALLEKAGLKGTMATEAASRSLQKTYRAYRASLTVTAKYEQSRYRKDLFRGYEKLEGIAANRRIAATLVTSNDLRAWFDQLASRAIAYIDSLPADAD